MNFALYIKKGYDMSDIKKVAVFLADGLEECEGLIVVDLLRRAKITVDTISIMGKKNILSSHNISLEADLLFDEADLYSYDALFLPGGLVGSQNLSKHDRLLSLINDYYKSQKYVTAICAAPFIFAKLGILKNKNATSYPSFKTKILNGGANYIEKKVVKDGNIITSMGLGCAFLFAGTLIEALDSKETAQNILDSICY